MSEHLFTFGTAFTGIGGFDLALEQAGGQCLWQIEIDKKARAVLRKRFPGVPIHHDVKEANKTTRLPSPTVFAWGSPCQGASVAGRRGGLVDPRTRLYFEGWRISRELAPRFIVFENVPGLFSTNAGLDFAVVLGGFTGRIPLVPKEGWGSGGFMRAAAPDCYCVAWRVLDARYFEVPQRRERIVIVASLGEGSCAQILFEPSTMQRHPCESGTEGQDVAATLGSCTPSGGKRTTEVEGTLIAGAGTCGTLRARAGGGGGPDDTTAQANQLVAAFRLQNGGHYTEDAQAGTKQARDFKSPTDLVVTETTGGVGDEKLRAAFLAGNGSDQVGTLCCGGKSEGFAGQDVGNLVMAFDDHTTNAPTDNHSHALTTGKPACIAFSAKDHGQNGGGQVAVAFQSRVARNGRGAPSDALTAEAGRTGCGDSAPMVAIAFNGRQDPVPSTGAAGSSDTDGHSQQVAICEGGHGVTEMKETTALQCGGGKPGQGFQMIRSGWTVRRLTPREHERLQGFPDDWTAEGIDDTGKPIKLKDGPRYRQTGNAVCVNVFAWVAHRIAHYLKTHE